MSDRPPIARTVVITRRKAAICAAVLTLLFVFRLAYGLASMFWTDDEREVFVIGLRSYARREWPFFGADIVWTNSQLPGAMQAMLVRVPLEAWSVPEAPFILLNALSFGALALFAWYCRKRLPGLPAWFVWGTLFLLPWTLNFSTHIVNTSYILPGAIVFFVGFFEATPGLLIGVVPQALAWTMMGAALAFLAQIHMSWVLLPPYVVLAAVATWRKEGRAPVRAAAAFAVGAAATGSLLLPTLLWYGVSAGAVGNNVNIHLQPPQEIATIAARFLSFPAFDINRFIGLDRADRLLFLRREPWVVPFALILLVAGLVQPVLMAVLWFRRGDHAWTRIKWLSLSTVLWIYGSFFFSVRGPLAHAFYVVFPIAALYAFYGWRWLAGLRLWQIARAVLVSSVILHLGVIVWQLPRRSLYRDRALAQAAIDARNDRFLGDRRDSLVEQVDHHARPIDGVDPDAYESARPLDDLNLVRADWSPLIRGRVSRFAVTIENRGRHAAYLNIGFTTKYRDNGGRVVAERRGLIREILEPGVRRAWPDVTDGMVPPGAVSAELALADAEKAIPVTAQRRSH